MEDYAYILDYLAQGLPEEKKFKREPIAYAIGESEFKLLELIPKEGAIINIGDRVYIGKETEKREKILHVKRRISYTDLTNAAQSELPFILENIVLKNEPFFVKFFNECGAISFRQHVLELLPGLGKKTMTTVLDERKKRPFTSFKDIEERVPNLRNPVKLITKRIEIELSEPSEKYHLFVRK
ncbi:MAG: DUF655 domain-containing protein [Thermoplasmata archaeon]